MKSIITTKGILATAIALALSNSAIASESVNEFDQSLTLKLHNELRLADRPSACGDGDYDSNGNPNTTPIDRDCQSGDVKAWVQGAMLDYETDNLLSWLDVQAFGYTVQKLWSPDDATSRFYLDGSDSFYLAGGSLNLKPIDGMVIKIGRWGNDAAYGTFDHVVPLLEYSSVRTMPSMKEGALFRYSSDNSNVYAAVTTKTAGGYSTAWTDERLGHNNEKSEKYFAAYVYDDPMKHFALGVSYQNDHSVQTQINTDYAWTMEDGSFVKVDGRLFNANLVGETKDVATDGLDSAYVASALITYVQDKAFMNAGIGQVGDRLDGFTLVDTDIGFPFDMSISRNYQDTTSWSMGAGYNFNENWTTILSLVKTDGALNHKETTDVDGIGANLIIAHKFTEGGFKGLKTQLILNKAQEERRGVVNENLDYYDINLDIRYTFNLM